MQCTQQPWSGNASWCSMQLVFLFVPGQLSGGEGMQQTSLRCVCDSCLLILRELWCTYVFHHLSVCKVANLCSVLLRHQVPVQQWLKNAYKGKGTVDMKEVMNMTAQLQRIGSDQTRLFSVTYAGMLAGQSHRRMRCLWLTTPLILSMPDTKPFFASLLNGNCFWWRFRAYFETRPTDIGIVVQGHFWEEALDMLLQFRSDQFWGLARCASCSACGQVQSTFCIWKHCRWTSHPANFRGVTGCHFGDAVDNVTFHTFSREHRNL